MSELPALIGAVAGGFALLGFVPYLVTMVRGKTRPNRASWWIWTVIGTLLAGSYYATGARDSLWVPLSYVVGPLLTALLALKYGEGGWTRLDRACFAGAGGSLLLWVVSGSPLAALLVNILIDIFGAMPTIRKSYTDPESEDRLSWGLFLVGDALNLFAIRPWSLETAIYPLYLFGLAGLITLLLARRG